MYQKLVLFISLIACASALALACSRSQPGFSHDAAVERARESAQQSAPEVGILEARIDDAAAELIPLQEADRRMDSERGAAGYRPGQDKDTPVWWVRVQGYFRFEGMPVPDGKYPVYEAKERIFIYDARTGEEMGSRMPYTPPAGVDQSKSATATPTVSLSREQAIEAALEIARSGQPEIGPAQVPPRNVQAELVTWAEARRRVEGSEDVLADAEGDRPVWLVTMEGLWQGGFPMPTDVPTPEPYPRYVVVLDVLTGEALMVAARR